MRAKTVEFERGKDPKRAMGLGLEAQMLDYFKEGEVYALIDYLDGIPEFKPYRIENASYDDPHYNDVPMELLEKYGITTKVLDLIHDNIQAYEGWIMWDDPAEAPGPGNKMSCGGGA